MQVRSNNRHSYPKDVGLHRLPKRTEPMAYSCDTKAVLELIDYTPKTHFVIKSMSCSSDYKVYSARTVKAAIKKGIVDLDGWFFVNDVRKVDEPYYDHRGFLRHRSVTTSCKTDGNVVFDFDDVPGADTPLDMLKIIIDRGLPIPVFIVKTSRRSYHVLYKAKRGTWTTQKKLEYGFKFIGEKVPDTITTESINRLYAAGVDYNYLLQDTDMCKMRIPGSCRVSMTGLFICEYLYIPEGDVPADKISLSLNEANPLERPKKGSKVDLVNKNDKFYSLHYDNVSSLLAPHVPKKHLSKIAKHLTSHLGFLFKDKCQLSQTEIAKVTGASQPTISRIIRTLVKTGVLSVMMGGYYHYGKESRGTPKTYGAGPALKKVLKMVDEKVVRKQLAVPYEAGEANTSMLRDIGLMYKCGFTNEDIVRVCDQKMRSRGDRRKSRREIDRAVRRWDERNEGLITRPSKPIVDPNSILIIVGSE